MSQSLAATVLFLAGTSLALWQSDQQRHDRERASSHKRVCHRHLEGNWEDIPAVEISSKLEGDQLAGRAVFYVVDSGAGEVIK